VTKPGLQVKVLGGIKFLISEPEDPTCPRCDKSVESLKLPGDKWGLPHYPVLWVCPICKECEEELKDKEIPLAQKLVAVGIVGRMLSMTLGTFQITDERAERAKRVAVGFVEAPDHNLWLFGGVGSGKTHLAVAMIRALYGSGRSILFQYVPTLLDELRDSFALEDDKRLKRHRVSTADVLVLDDLGCEKRTDWARERLTVIANERSVHGRPTIVTSNLKPSEVAERLGDRLVSRLREDGLTVDLGQEDRRVKKRKKKGGTR
jgi:DNA replication protein DnaC